MNNVPGVFLFLNFKTTDFFLEKLHLHIAIFFNVEFSKSNKKKGI